MTRFLQAFPNRQLIAGSKAPSLHSPRLLSRIHPGASGIIVNRCMVFPVTWQEGLTVNDFLHMQESSKSVFWNSLQVVIQPSNCRVSVAELLPTEEPAAIPKWCLYYVHLGTGVSVRDEDSVHAHEVQTPNLPQRSAYSRHPIQSAYRKIAFN